MNGTRIRAEKTLSRSLCLRFRANEIRVRSRMPYELDNEKARNKQQKQNGITSIESRCIGMPNVNQDIGKWFTCFNINDTYVQ